MPVLQRKSPIGSPRLFEGSEICLSLKCALRNSERFAGIRVLFGFQFKMIKAKQYGCALSNLGADREGVRQLG